MLLSSGQPCIQLEKHCTQRNHHIVLGARRAKQDRTCSARATRRRLRNLQRTHHKAHLCKDQTTRSMHRNERRDGRREVRWTACLLLKDLKSPWLHVRQTADGREWGIFSVDPCLGRPRLPRPSWAAAEKLERQSTDGCAIAVLATGDP